jgi:hypothetical protein
MGAVGLNRFSMELPAPDGSTLRKVVLRSEPKPLGGRETAPFQIVFRKELSKLRIQKWGQTLLGDATGRQYPLKFQQVEIRSQRTQTPSVRSLTYTTPGASHSTILIPCALPASSGYQSMTHCLLAAKGGSKMA